MRQWACWASTSRVCRKAPATPERASALARASGSASKRGTALAFDFGEKRIGVAVGDSNLRIAHPLATISAADNARRFADIAGLITEWQPAVLVVGVPHRSDSGEHPLASACRRFARRLQARFSVAVALVDETLTSSAAGEALGAAGVTGKKQKAVIDQVAAQQILQTYFDETA